MKIDTVKCISCLECIDFCPMGAIIEDDQIIEIDQDECVECGVCSRTDICPVDALYMPEESMKHPRLLRAAFSDVTVKHPKGIHGGRGTEEMKTNDVTGRFRRGEYGIALEFGRPGIGSRIAEIEKVTKILCPMNIEIEKDNPLYDLIEDPDTGSMRPDVIQEKIMSAILEIKIKEDQLEDFIKVLMPVLEKVNTVVSLGLITRFDADGTLPVLERLQKTGLKVRPNGKINMGMGRPLIEQEVS
jgi:NAD-dependent dihydropyrimidine dehydrogenase PreA subunit